MNLAEKLIKILLECFLFIKLEIRIKYKYLVKY